MSQRMPCNEFVLKALDHRRQDTASGRINTALTSMIFFRILSGKT